MEADASSENARASDGLDLAGLRVQVPAGDASQRRRRQRLGLADAGLVETLRANADLVHAHFGVDAVDAWPSVERAGLPMLVTLHGYDITTRKTWWWSGRGGVARIAYPSRLKRLFRAPRVTFIAVSDAIRNDAIRWGLPPDRVVTQRIGINVDKFHPSGLPIREREQRILFVGRLVEKKGARYLIEAMARVRAQVPGCGAHHRRRRPAACTR